MDLRLKNQHQISTEIPQNSQLLINTFFQIPLTHFKMVTWTQNIGAEFTIPAILNSCSFSFLFLFISKIHVFICCISFVFSLFLLISRTISSYSQMFDVFINHHKKKNFFRYSGTRLQRDRRDRAKVLLIAEVSL